MANEYSVDYHPSLLGLTSRVHPLIFLHLSLEFLGKIFKFFLKMHLQVKNLNLDIFAHASSVLPRFLSSPPSKRELLIAPGSQFFEDLIPSRKKGEGETF